MDPTKEPVLEGTGRSKLMYIAVTQLCKLSATPLYSCATALQLDLLHYFSLLFVDIHFIQFSMKMTQLRILDNNIMERVRFGTIGINKLYCWQPRGFVSRLPFQKCKPLVSLASSVCFNISLTTC